MNGVRLRALSSVIPTTSPIDWRGWFRSDRDLKAERVPYDPQTFFESVYGAADGGQLDDRYTISPDFDPIAARYHYNAVENSLFLALRRFGPKTTPPVISRVLDLGSGSGHWIDFFLEHYQSSEVCGVEIARPASEFLSEKYAADGRVRVLTADIADAGFGLEDRFDVISAVGVIFHIVEDAKWKTALGNLTRLLTDDGIILVGGQFGLVTTDVQFHKLDEFTTLAQVRASEAPRVRVNKRLRSLGVWQAVAREVGLEVRGLQITKRQRAMWTPQNNILILGRAKRA